MKDPTVLVMVLDAVGVDTLNRYLDVGDAKLPNLRTLGLGNLLAKRHHNVIEPVDADLAIALNPSPVWPDSVMGHRELMGYIDPQNYAVFRDGFPDSYVEGLASRIGRDVLYNKRAGGQPGHKGES